MPTPMPTPTPTLMPPAAEKPVRPNDTEPIQPQVSNTKEDQHEHQRRLQRQQQIPERTTRQDYETDKTTLWRPDLEGMQPETDEQAEHLSQPTPYRATKSYEELRRATKRRDKEVYNGQADII